MKRLLLSALCLLVMTVASAQNNSSLKEKASSLVGGKAVFPVSEREGVACFNVEGGGFVIVSALDEAPLLGYSTTGCLVADNVPPAFEAWLDDVSLGVAKKTTVQRPSSPKDRLSKVDPLLTSTWTQSGYGYNSYTPSVGNEMSQPTVGCAALAMGQVMRYWRYPQHGVGSTTYSHQGQYPCWNYDTLTVHYGNYQYNWDLMPDELTYASSNAERKAVGRFLYHCGVSLKMLYNIDCNGSSGAEEYSQITALKEVFGYNSDARLVRRDSMDADSWSAMLKTELSEGRPVLFAGYCRDDEGNPTSGHAFVLDGYDTEGLFHVNWGWGGNHDGYYAITLLNPMAGMSFTTSQTAIVGLDTNQGHSPVLRLASNLEFDNYHIDTTGLVKGHYLLTNSGDARFDGFVGLAVYDTLTEDDHYRHFYRYMDTREVHLEVGDTMIVDINRHEYFEVGRYHFCLHFGEEDFSADTTEERSQRMFDACYDFEHRVLVDNPITVSIPHIARSPLKVYPNPANSYLMVESESAEKITITDRMGRVVLTQESEHTATRLDISSLPRGIYIIKVGTQIGRFVK